MLGIDKIGVTIKQNAIKSVSIASAVAMLGLYTAVITVLDERYALAEDARDIQQEVQQIRKDDLEDKLLVIEMKEARGDATDIDKALKERYIRRLHEYEN